jgi:hypothetical protein
MSHNIEYAIFEDSLQTPPASPKLSQGGVQASSSGGVEPDDQENIDPQQTAGQNHTDESGESQPGMHLTTSHIQQIDPALLQTFYHAGSDYADQTRHDTFYEAANDTEANDTDVASGLVVVKVVADAEESRFGSPSPSEIARLAPEHRAQIDVFVHSWTRGVARAGALEAEAGPALSTISEVSADTESAAALSHSTEVPQRDMGITRSLHSPQQLISDLESSSDEGYAPRSYPYWDSEDEDKSEPEGEAQLENRRPVQNPTSKSDGASSISLSVNQRSRRVATRISRRAMGL